MLVHNKNEKKETEKITTTIDPALYRWVGAVTCCIHNALWRQVYKRQALFSVGRHCYNYVIMWPCCLLAVRR